MQQTYVPACTINRCTITNQSQVIQTITSISSRCRLSKRDCIRMMSNWLTPLRTIIRTSSQRRLGESAAKVNKELTDMEALLEYKFQREGLENRLTFLSAKLSIEGETQLKIWQKLPRFLSTNTIQSNCKTMYRYVRRNEVLTRACKGFKLVEEEAEEVQRTICTTYQEILTNLQQREVSSRKLLPLKRTSTQARLLVTS